MEDMRRSTFHTSQSQRAHRRTAGPQLVLVAGTAAPATTVRALPDWHPASEEFTPDASAGDRRLRPVRDSEPGSPALRSTSRGSATPDVEGAASPGSGPNVSRDELLDRIERFLEATAGDAPARTAAPAVR